jgi:hypothetical protein
MTGSFQKFQYAFSEFDFVAIIHTAVRKCSSSFCADADGCAGTLGKFVMAGNKVGVKMRLNDVSDFQTLLFRLFNVNIHVALRIHDRGNAIRTDHVRGMGETRQIE